MRRVVTAILVAALLLPVIAAPAAGASRYRLNLFRSGDFVSQVNARTCVGASIQMMVNMGGPNDRRAATQLRYWYLARSMSESRWGGTNSRGWAKALGELGEGPYMVDSRTSLRGAVTHAARVMRQTGRPVGLLVWHGAHAWVLHGFEATADPLRDADAKITTVYVSDPWYPRDHSVYGAAPRPNSRLSIAQLGRDFKPWQRRRPNPEKDGRYFLVLPFPAYLTNLGPGAWLAGDLRS
jgi:hypothetical protein